MTSSPIKQLSSPMSHKAGIDTQNSIGSLISASQTEKTTAVNSIEGGVALKVVTERGTKHRLDDDQLEGEKENKHAKTAGADISPSNESIVIKVEVDDGAMSNGVGNDNNGVSSISNDTSTASNARDATKDEVKILAADTKKIATKGPEKPPAVLAVERFVTAIKSHVTKTFNLLVQSASRGESSVPDSEMDAVRRMTLEQMKLANIDMMSIGGIGCFSDDAMKSQMDKAERDAMRKYMDFIQTDPTKTAYI